MEKFCITIGSLPHKERLVADIFYDNVQWAEISQEVDDELVIEFYAHPRGGDWSFPLEEALKILEQAKNKLLEIE